MRPVRHVQIVYVLHLPVRRVIHVQIVPLALGHLVTVPPVTVPQIIAKGVAVLMDKSASLKPTGEQLKIYP